MTHGTEKNSGTPIDYIELPATDLDESKAFYGETFGWTFEDFHDGYVGFQHARGFGGFPKVASVVRGGPLPVLYADSLDPVKERVREAGAEITVEETTFPGGRRFLFLDPSGNELGVWSDDIAKREGSQ